MTELKPRLKPTTEDDRRTIGAGVRWKARIGMKGGYVYGRTPGEAYNAWARRRGLKIELKKRLAK